MIKKSQNNSHTNSQKYKNNIFVYTFSQESSGKNLVDTAVRMILIHIYK